LFSKTRLISAPINTIEPNMVPDQNSLINEPNLAPVATEPVENPAAAVVEANPKAQKDPNAQDLLKLLE
jgi:hypothetical protein